MLNRIVILVDVILVRALVVVIGYDKNSLPESLSSSSIRVPTDSMGFSLFAPIPTKPNTQSCYGGSFLCPLIQHQQQQVAGQSQTQLEQKGFRLQCFRGHVRRSHGFVGHFDSRDSTLKLDRWQRQSVLHSMSQIESSVNTSTAMSSRLPVSIETISSAMRLGSLIGQQK